jgi:hypothetical protein
MLYLQNKIREVSNTVLGIDTNPRFRAWWPWRSAAAIVVVEEGLNLEEVLGKCCWAAGRDSTECKVLSQNVALYADIECHVRGTDRGNTQDDCWEET